MYDSLIEYKIEANQEMKEEKEKQGCPKEYKTNLNILAGKLKESFFEMIFAKNQEEQNKIEKKVYETAKRNLILTKKKESTSRKYNSSKSKHPYNNRKNF